MIRSFGLEQLPAGGVPSTNGGSIVSIGVFDGVHVGHQAILEANVALAKAEGLTSSVVTFAGHPKQVLLGRAPKTLTTIAHRLALFERAGIEHTLVLEFTEELRNMSALTFLQDILLDGLDARAFLLGFDSKFGRGQEGSAAFLQAQGQKVQVIDRVLARDRAASSTAIREAVELGDLVGASNMLGRRVSVLGQVVHGNALGRTLGFPTANLNLEHELHPPGGVYAGFARLIGDPDRRRFPAMANIGYRPTVQSQVPQSSGMVEVHLIGLSEDLYGSQVEFEFVERLREEKQFEGLDALKTQLAADRIATSELLSEKAPDFGLGISHQ
ncbi:MAG: riboflavin biosynthesis protein RibF [Planctomycetota bacterium]|nr:riboflavin biosynthesis protein RibF [Planctomycetota bacterium]